MNLYLQPLPRNVMPSIFISFSTADGGDIAEHDYRHYKKKGYDAFYSTEEIPYGHKWREEIKKHIEECDVFLLIATYEALGSKEVAKEIEEAKRLGKLIIPCRANDIDWSDLEKLGIDLAQGPEFDSKYELVRKLESQLRRQFVSTSVDAPQKDSGTDPRNPYNDLTIPHYNPYLGKKNDSSQHIQKPAQTYADDAVAWRNKGVALIDLDRDEEATKYFDKALEIDPNYLSAWMDKAGALTKLGRFEEVIECCSKALEINSDYAPAWNNKGVALYKLARFEEAITCYDKAIKIDPKYAGALHNKSVALKKLGRFEEARAYHDASKILGQG